MDDGLISNIFILVIFAVMHHQSPLESVRRRLTSFYVINIIFIHGDFTQVTK